MLPHAGYFYSGKTACEVVRRIRVPDRVFLMGPNHTGCGGPFALHPKGEWSMPFGNVAVDHELSSQLAEACHEIRPDEAAHRSEHCLEVQIPFLQIRNSELRITPMVVGCPDLFTVRRVAWAIGHVLSPMMGELLVVVSSDMSHYESDEATRRKDRYALQAIENLDENALEKAVKDYRITMCGFLPAYMLLVMKDSLGIRKATLVDYTTSADASGERARVVGYAGFIFE